MKRSVWLNIFLVLVGIVVGSMAAAVSSDIPWLSWLSYGLDFGTNAPVSVDLHAIKFTLGINVNINISMILFIVLSLILGKFIADK